MPSYWMRNASLVGSVASGQTAGIRDLISSQVNPSGVPGPAGFAYVKSVVVTNGGASQLANYAAMVTVAYVAGKMKTDFSDIRFTLDGSIIPLACWRRTYTASSTAQFWVNIPTLPTGATSINLFYGNAAAATTSSIQGTFPAFADDFEAGDAAFRAAWTCTGATGTDGNTSVQWMTRTSYDGVAGSAMRGTYSLQVIGHYSGSVSSTETAYTGRSSRQFSVPAGSYRLEFLEQGMMGSYAYDKIRVSFTNVTDSTVIKEWIYGAGVQTIACGVNITLSAVTSYTWDFTLAATKTLKFEAAGHCGGWSGNVMLDEIFLRNYPATAPTVGAAGAELGASG
jgi:Domain of unknown function (DUF2341)